MNPTRVLILVLSYAACLSRGSVVDSEICVYGGTSGGVVAAVAAARLGKQVALLTQNPHVGGMSSGGLGVTDIGVGNNTSYLGGLSREFYERVAKKYGKSGLVIWFEPHVAEEVFWDMLREQGVPVYTNQLIAEVTSEGGRIQQIRMEDGTLYRARMFIDTTYEGDLMAGAGVTFTVGREGANVYQESLAGIRPLSSGYNYDPYVIPGSPGSGLLPFVQTSTTGSVGEGDHRLQAYNFRLCLTQVATNRIPITPPEDYNESTYELFRRYIDSRIAVHGSVKLGDLIHIQQIIPNGKTDINANGELSTDMVGYNYTWATNTHAGREVIRKQHENYIRGMLYFFATSTNLPKSLRDEAASWGLAKDEFQDTQGWPHQIYVREARRMVGDYVMRQQNADGRASVPDPIALGRYTIDSHGVQRLVVGGVSKWEGSIGGSVPFPYGISYRSIVPRVGECDNLFCTFALSASHVGFASARMEPVFMMTSHSAAAAASVAIDDDVPVQQVNYNKLAALLRAEGQLLRWESAGASTNGIILDQGGPGTSFAGAWTAGANAGGWNGDYWHDQAGGKGSKWVTYTPTLPTNGTYEVYLWWVESSNRPTNVSVDIVHATGTERVLVNQRLSSGGWFKIYTGNFSAGSTSSVTIRNEGTAAGTYVIADGVRFLPVGNIAVPPPAPTIEVVAADARLEEFRTNMGRIVFVRSGPTNDAITVQYAVGGTAQAGVDYQELQGAVTLIAGMLSTNVLVRPIADTEVEGDETVEVTLQPGAGYTRTTVTNVTMVLRDRPVDAWKKLRFSATDLGRPEVAGDLSDPDGDGLANLLEYAMGTSPLTDVAGERFHAYLEGGEPRLSYSYSETATDVQLLVESSTDLLAWSSAGVELVQEEFATGYRKVILALRSEATPGFLRFKVVYK